MIDIDLNDFTLGEVEDIERVAEIYFRELFKSKKSGIGLAACLWVIRRRENPDYTLEQAKAEKLRDVSLVFNEPDPTPGGASKTT